MELLSDEAVSVPEDEESAVPELVDPVPVMVDVSVVPVPVAFEVPELVVVSALFVEDAADVVVAVCVAVAADAV